MKHAEFSLDAGEGEGVLMIPHTVLVRSWRAGGMGMNSYCGFRVILYNIMHVLSCIYPQKASGILGCRQQV